MRSKAHDPVGDARVRSRKEQRNVILLTMWLSDSWPKITARIPHRGRSNVCGVKCGKVGVNEGSELRRTRHTQDGTDGEGRTHTSIRKPDFESSASANSATSARGGLGISRNARAGATKIHRVEFVWRSNAPVGNSVQSLPGPRSSWFVDPLGPSVWRWTCKPLPPIPRFGTDRGNTPVQSRPRRQSPCL